MLLPGEGGAEKREGFAGTRGRLQQRIDAGRTRRQARLLESRKHLAHERQLRAIRLERKVDGDAANAEGGVGKRHGENY